MVNVFLASQARAEEAPIQDMDFFLFLADSIIDEGQLVTPLDLQQIKLPNKNEIANETHDEEEASDE
jgi:hypothetical protein